MTQKYTPITWRSALLLVASLLLASPVFADHPGENLNQVMAAKEAAFEPILPGDAPDLAWIGAAHESTSLNALRGKIVVLSFVPEGCGDPCEVDWPPFHRTPKRFRSVSYTHLTLPTKA